LKPRVELPDSVEIFGYGG
jgi:hypothetical protein